MTCFWTDLVGTTQQCETAPSGLVVAIGGSVAFAATAASPSSIAAIVAAFDADFMGSTSPDRVDKVAVDAFGDFVPESANAVYNNVCPMPERYDPVASALPLSWDDAIGLADGTVRANAAFEELVASGSLSVTGAWKLAYDSCGGPYAGTTVSALTASDWSASIPSLGILRITKTAGGVPDGGNKFSYVLRVEGTVTGENGGVVDVDVLLMDGSDYCF